MDIHAEFFSGGGREGQGMENSCIESSQLSSEQQWY